MYETAIFPELEYTFKHALTHEVAYGSLLQERRRELHGRIVDAIERLYRERLAEYVGRLADHAIRAERWEDAVRYARQAGDRAMELLANAEALHRFEQALAALGHLPQQRETLEQAIDVRLEMRPALISLDDMSHMGEVLREAEGLAQQIDDVRRLARVRALMIRNLTVVGDMSGAIEIGEQVVQAGQALGDPSIWIPAAHMLSDTLRSRGDFRVAVEYCQRIADATRGDLRLRRFGLVSITSMSSRGYWVRCLAQLGETRAALTVAEDAIRMAEAAGDIPTLSYVLALITDGYITLGRTDLAMASAQRYQSLLPGIGDANDRRWDLPLFGMVYAAAGRDAEALQFLEAAAEWAAMSQRVSGLTIEGVLWLGTVYLRAGRINDAESTALRLVNSMRLRDLPAYLARALCLAAEVAAAREPCDANEAVTRYREALGIAEGLEMRPLQAHCHLGLGKVYRHVGRLEEARSELTTAVAMLREMGMLHWLPEAERELEEADGSAAVDHVG
jgi:tetratricopeptide (TPR) repeat protein